jgi:hypothetical protein
VKVENFLSFYCVPACSFGLVSSVVRQAVRTTWFSEGGCLVSLMPYDRLQCASSASASRGRASRSHVKLRGPDRQSVLFALAPPLVQSITLLFSGPLYATERLSVKSEGYWRGHRPWNLDHLPSIDFTPRLQRPAGLTKHLRRIVACKKEHTSIYCVWIAAD